MLGTSDLTPLLLAWMGPLLAQFTAPTARHALVLITGAVLAPARRTVAAALRAAGYGQAADFTSYHRVLNRNRWSCVDDRLGARKKWKISNLVRCGHVSGLERCGTHDRGP